jgi:hypothetical protein
LRSLKKRILHQSNCKYFDHLVVQFRSNLGEESLLNFCFPTLSLSLSLSLSRLANFPLCLNGIKLGTGCDEDDIETDKEEV